MSYLICRMQKYKQTDLRGIQLHNQRQSKDNKNKDIDSSLSALNYDLVNDKPINYTTLPLKTELMP